MNITYVEFVCTTIKKINIGIPIYTNQIAEHLGEAYQLDYKAAVAATAVAIKRILDGEIIPELRMYQKGIYYRTTVTPFGEVGINREQLIADKYLLPHNGYETGLTVMHSMGLTTQMPRKRILATNTAKECTREDKKLEVTIRPPKITVTEENKYYLQMLDVLEMMDKAPVDAEAPYEILAKQVYEKKLEFGILLAFANNFYNRNTILQLANVASAGGMI